MAINILPPQQSLGSMFGQSFGAGLGQGLNQLAQQKLQQVQQRQQQSELAKLLQAPSVGYDQGTAELLSNLIQQNPQSMSQLFGLLGAGGYGVGQQQAPANVLGMGPQGTPLAPEATQQAQQRPTFAQAAQAGAQAKLSAQERKAKALETKAALTETKVFRDEALKGLESARGDIHRLDRLQELEKEGKLDSPSYLNFLKQADLNLPALMNEGTPEYEKIVQDFTKNAKDVFGSRISNFEIENFLRTLPNLSMSSSGRNRVIANLRYFAEAKKAKGEAVKDILKQNKGIPPFDLAVQVDDAVESKLDNIADRYKKNLAKEVPEAESKWKTLLAHYSGKTIGSLPGLAKAAGQAGLGALAGSRFGPYGAVGGGLLGAAGGLSNLFR